MLSPRALIPRLICVLFCLASSRSVDPPAIRPYAGTGMFVMLSDIHFDPYTDPAIMRELGRVQRRRALLRFLRSSRNTAATPITRC